MNANRWGLALLLLATLVEGGCATGVHAARPGPAPASQTDVSAAGRMVVEDEHAQMTIVFSENDRRHIHDYYYREHERYRDKKEKHEKGKALPPGLAKRDALPPGLQRQIRRNGQLPPGIEGRRLPDELEHRLTPLPVNYIRLQVGRDIVLLNQRTRITVDVIKNIFPE